MHQDIQPGNLFLFPKEATHLGDMSVAVGGWGSSALQSIEQSPSSLAATAATQTRPRHYHNTDSTHHDSHLPGIWGFQAPELFSDTHLFSQASDIWSAGMTIVSLYQPEILADLYSNPDEYLQEIRHGPRAEWFTGTGWQSSLGHHSKSPA